MNCKPGDLAVLVRSSAGNEGRIVEVIDFIGEVQGWSGNDRWAVKTDRPMFGCFGGLVFSARDKHLRPIRDNDGEDETLSWAGLPHKEHA